MTKMGLPDVRFDFTLDGEKLRLEYRRVPLQAWRDVKAETGLTPQTLFGAVGQSDVEASIALVFLARQAQGRRVSFRQAQKDLEQAEEYDLLYAEVEGEVTFEADDYEAPESDPPTSGS